jgi:hypothetical protein
MGGRRAYDAGSLTGPFEGNAQRPAAS